MNPPTQMPHKLPSRGIWLRGELAERKSISRDCGVSSPTIQQYFQILVDTLLGRWLLAYTKRPKRRIIAAPKFYFADVGVVNYLARR
jgi:uncharacterized protein